MDGAGGRRKGSLALGGPCRHFPSCPTLFSVSPSPSALTQQPLLKPVSPDLGTCQGIQEVRLSGGAHPPRAPSLLAVGPASVGEPSCVSALDEERRDEGLQGGRLRESPFRGVAEAARMRAGKGAAGFKPANEGWAHGVSLGFVQGHGDTPTQARAQEMTVPT